MHESTRFHKRFNRFLCYNAQYTGAVCKSAPSHVTLTDFSCSCDVSRQLGSNFDQTERQIFKAILFRKSLSEVEFLGNHWSQGPSTNNLAPHSRAPEHSCQCCELHEPVDHIYSMGNRQINHGRRRRRRSLLCVLMSEVCSMDDFTGHFCSLKGVKEGLKNRRLKNLRPKRCFIRQWCKFIKICVTSGLIYS